MRAFMIGEEHFQKENYHRALKFYHKSEQLFPTSKATEKIQITAHKINGLSQNTTETKTPPRKDFQRSKTFNSFERPTQEKKTPPPSPTPSSSSQDKKTPPSPSPSSTSSSSPSSSSPSSSSSHPSHSPKDESPGSSNKKKANTSKSAPRFGKETSNSSDNVRQRRPFKRAQTSFNLDKNESAERYTQQQKNLVDKILAAGKDYYKILDIPRNSSPAQIKKAYRKLALLCHPDKNEAPGAEQCFREITCAYTCLSNPEKKSLYDRTGIDSENTSQRPSNRTTHYTFYRHAGRANPYWNVNNNDDLFDMLWRSNFFHFEPGVGVRRPNVVPQQRRRRRAQRREDKSTPVMTFFQLFPLFVLLLLGFLSIPYKLSSVSQVYSFEVSSEFPVGRSTQNFGVRYFVRRDFEDKYNKQDISTLENKIEERVVGELKRSCYKEREYVSGLKKRAFWYSGKRKQTILETANAYQQKSCEKLEDFGISF